MWNSTPSYNLRRHGSTLTLSQVEVGGQPLHPYVDAHAASRSLPNSSSEICLRSRDEPAENRTNMRKHSSMTRLSRDGTDGDGFYGSARRIVDSCVQTDDEDGEERYRSVTSPHDTCPSGDVRLRCSTRSDLSPFTDDWRFFHVRDEGTSRLRPHSNVKTQFPPLSPPPFPPPPCVTCKGVGMSLRGWDGAFSVTFHTFSVSENRSVPMRVHPHVGPSPCRSIRMRVRPHEGQSH